MNPNDPQLPLTSPEPEEEFQPNLFMHRTPPGQQYSHTPLQPAQTLEERGFEIETAAMRRSHLIKKSIVALFVLILLGLVGGAGYYYLNVPLKTDYAAATTSISSYGSSQDGLTSDALKATLVMDGTADPAEVINADATNKKITDLDGKIAEVGKLKVMKDPAVAAAYHAFTDKYEKFKKIYRAEVLSGFTLMGQYTKACTALSNVSLKTNTSVVAAQTMISTTMQPCVDAANALKAAESPAIANYGATVTPLITTIKDQLNQYVGAKTNAQRTALQQQITATIAAIKSAGDNSLASISKEVADSNPKPELDALIAAIKTSQSKALI